jgi:hypothetical protein
MTGVADLGTLLPRGRNMSGGAATGQVRRLLGTPASRLAACLLAVSGLLLALSLPTHYAAYRAEVARPGSPEAAAWMSALRLFDVNGEGNLPAWFSSSLLLGGALLAAVLSVLVRRAGGRDAGWWAGLAVVLALLSLDEAASLHERLGDPAARVLGDAARGPLRFAWIVPGALLALAVGAAFVRFVVRLPAATRRLMVTAAAMYLTAAVGLEAAGGVVLDVGVSHAVYLLVSAAEEGLEMAGSILLLYALLRLLRLRPEPDGGYHLAVDLQRAGVPEPLG